MTEPLDDALIALRPAIAMRRRFIGRSVVDEEHFEIAERLGDDAFEALVDIVRHVVRGNDHADHGLFGDLARHSLQSSFSAVELRLSKLDAQQSREHMTPYQPNLQAEPRL